VACCKALNNLLGSKSIKEKLQIVLNQRGNFQCPGNLSIPPVAAPSALSNPAPSAKPTVSNGATPHVDLVLADLRKRGTSRPRKVSTLTSTIKALVKQQQQKSMSDGEAANLISELQKRGKVLITDTKVSYKLG
jgi:hypothetical protein